jgi:serine protease Do
MRRLRLLLLAMLLPGLLLALPRPVAAGLPLIADEMQTLPNTIAPLLPAVVNISTLMQPAGNNATGAQEMGKPVQSYGSGFIIDPAGYIVTNRHVVAGAYEVDVTLDNGTSYQAQVLSTNERPDLALLKINAEKPLPTVKWGDSDALRIGEPVFAIGNPLGLSSSVTVGVVSALNRDIDATMIDDFIQTDAAINHGNSGGPLFNLRGQVVGVSWALLAPGSETSGSAGLGLAIPSNDVKFVIDEMRRYGRFRAGFAGLRLQQVTPNMAAVLGLGMESGGIVSAVWPDGPAAKAGIREGDVVIAFNGELPSDVRAMLRDIGATPPGATVKLLLWRDHTSRTVDLTLGNWPNSEFNPAGPQVMPDRGPRMASADIGLRLGAITDEIRRTLNLASKEPAVSVLGVAANSAAADAGLSPGDVILRVGIDRVSSPDDVTKKLDEARAHGKTAVLMLVQTQDRPHWVVVPVGEAPKPEATTKQG